MAEKTTGMGRGLAAILAATPRSEAEELRQLPVDLIAANPRQPRRQFDEDGLLALAESIRVRGIIQPVLVRPRHGGRYELVAGERRWRAARLAGLEMIPAVVRDEGDAASLELALIENMAREDLNPVEEAHACAALVEELGLTREDVGLRVGRSRVAVSNLLRLLELPDEVLQLLERRQLSEGHGRALLLAGDNTDRRALARSVAASGWSVRELERRARAAVAANSLAIPPRRPVSKYVHPDQAAAAEQIADRLGAALGHEVSVTPTSGGYTAKLTFDSPEVALALAARLTSTASPGD